MSKKAKIDYSIVHTPQQLKVLKQAAVGRSVEVRLDRPFALSLLNAVKGNLNVEKLDVHVYYEDMITKVLLDALTDVIFVHPSISHLQIHGTYSSFPVDKSGCTSDDYRGFATAIARSESLQNVTITSDLPSELEKAIMEAMKHKSTSTTIHIELSELILRNPTNFAAMLATSKTLVSLHLSRVLVVLDDCNVEIHIRNGLRENQTLKELKIFELINDESSTYHCVLQGLEGNQSLEKLELRGYQAMNSSAALLLNNLVSNHRKLESLYVYVLPECVDALCEAVSQSPSITDFEFNPHSYSSSITQMLLTTKCLKRLLLHDVNEGTAMEELAVGMKACKTLTSLTLFYWKFTNEGTRAFVDAVLVNHSITEINYGERGDTRVAGLILAELKFYLSFNKAGRALLVSDMQPHVWPYALQKAGSSSLPDALYYYLQEMPELVMH